MEGMHTFRLYWKNKNVNCFFKNYLSSAEISHQTTTWRRASLFQRVGLVPDGDAHGDEVRLRDGAHLDHLGHVVLEGRHLQKQS